MGITSLSLFARRYHDGHVMVGGVSDSPAACLPSTVTASCWDPNDSGVIGLCGSDGSLVVAVHRASGECWQQRETSSTESVWSCGGWKEPASGVLVGIEAGVDVTVVCDWVGRGPQPSLVSSGSSPRCVSSY